MFHTVVQTRFLRNGDKNYICVIDNLLRIPTVKELSKSLNSWWSYCKRFDTMFFLTHSVVLSGRHYWHLKTASAMVVNHAMSCGSINACCHQF